MSRHSLSPTSCSFSRQPRSAAATSDAQTADRTASVGGADHEASTRGEVHELDVDSGVGELAGDLTEHAGTVLDIEHGHVALLDRRESAALERLPGPRQRRRREGGRPTGRVWRRHKRPRC